MFTCTCIYGEFVIGITVSYTDIALLNSENEYRQNPGLFIPVAHLRHT